eukprot:1591941-Prymnesium_polylepis.2
MAASLGHAVCHTPGSRVLPENGEVTVSEAKGQGNERLGLASDLRGRDMDAGQGLSEWAMARAAIST